ncbi:hypothetical protein Pst134EB_030054 [Puccinia striiformis f. sp. tritici]|nr:hypothetical protein Pst134EB_030054 [Puccinia striiformis f. sp. tritici]
MCGWEKHGLYYLRQSTKKEGPKWDCEADTGYCCPTKQLLSGTNEKEYKALTATCFRMDR